TRCLDRSGDRRRASQHSAVRVRSAGGVRPASRDRRGVAARLGATGGSGGVRGLRSRGGPWLVDATPGAVTISAMNDRSFTGRSARSLSLLIGLLMAVSVETVVLHLWLTTTHPVIVWSLTLLSLTTLIWLIADYRALGRPIISVTDHALQLTVGN